MFLSSSRKCRNLNNLLLKIDGIIALLVNLYYVTLFYDFIIGTKLVIGTKWYQPIFSNIDKRFVIRL